MMDSSASESGSTQIITTKPLERSKWSKIGDSIIILILLTVGLILEFQRTLTNPHTQYIPGLDDDTSINYNFAYPNTDAAVDTVGLIMITFLPWYILLIISAVYLYRMDESFMWKQYATHFYLVHRMVLFSFSVTLLVTDIIKLWVGSPRPYFLSVYNEPIQDPHELFEARLSFPSGHASEAMSTLFLLTIVLYKSWEYTQNMYYNQTYIIGMKTGNPHAYYLCGLWHLMRELPLIGITFVFIPMYISIWNGLTRIRDYKHFAADVVGGMLLGASIAYVTYLIFYNEMYSGFNYRLNDQIQQKIRTNVASNDTIDNNDTIDKKDNNVPLKQIITQSNDS